MLYNAKNPHGGDVYAGDIDLDFSANTNPFGVPEGVKSAISVCLDKLDRYPDPYCRKLISAIAAHMDVPKGYILGGNGAAELIYSWCEAARPKNAIELAPTFSEYSLALERTGCEVHRHLLREDEGFAVTDRLLSDIEKLRPDSVFLCDPNNPTGRLTDPLLKAELLETCARLGIRLFADECFLDFTGGKSYVGKASSYPNLTVLKAFTKIYGMAGIRLGYAISSDAELLKKMSRTVQPWNVSTIAQEAGTAALRETGYIEKTKRLIEKERQRLAVELSALGLTVFPSDANFLLFKGDPSLSGELRKHGIALRECSNYVGLGPGFFRTAVKLPEQNDRLIEAIRGVLWQKT